MTTFLVLLVVGFFAASLVAPLFLDGGADSILSSGRSRPSTYADKTKAAG